VYEARVCDVHGAVHHRHWTFALQDLADAGWNPWNP